ncbi:MAG: endopeptidase La [Lachnospiraceae bacterium]|nr:endopeptidase La [Lachnospiraceae bacterium]
MRKKNDKNINNSNTASVMPVVIIKDLTLFPGMSLQFDLEKKAAVKAVEAALISDQRVFLIKDTAQDENAEEQLAPVGTIAAVQQVLKIGNGMIRVQLNGEHRGSIKSLDRDSAAYITADIDTISDKDTGFDKPERREAVRRELIAAMTDYAGELGGVDPRFLIGLGRIKDVGALADKISANLPLEDEDRQHILNTVDVDERSAELLKSLAKEMLIVKQRKEISEEISRQVDSHQREYILREQMAFIQSELDEDNDEASETEQYKKAVEELKAPQEVKDKLAKEIRHMELGGFSNPENATLRSYIETLLELPWDKTTESFEKPVDISNARKILERDHYGLKEVKERVLEYLAVRSLTKKGESPILCLVGPPGTGKTSVARSIAEATARPYVRICLGGVRDEAEIRGHRKTYVGAMPGRITAGLKQAGVKDPLMLLDEIDKMSADYHGDTASAMLEVLDSEQNKNFRDHYVELPMDLSQVLFIATANDESTIPRPLLDRMEIIEIAGYTANEKFHIAKEHLIKKVFERNGIDASNLKVSDGAIRKIIECYCREAGVRELERELDKLCRKAAVKTLEKKGKRGPKKDKGPLKVTDANLEEYLGKIRFPKEHLNGRNEVGIVRGLAWTSVGGDTLQIEVNIMPGKGELALTGQLGDVMKESAMAGLSYVRSVVPRYNVPDSYFQEHDIHIHIPEGAVPKDGPSAGITMATAVLSAITGKKVRRDLAMTGEISLRGRVMPVGGLKEKILAAKMLGIRTVLVPFENKRDVEEIDTEITGGLEILYMKDMDEVIEQAFYERKKSS